MSLAPLSFAQPARDPNIPRDIPIVDQDTRDKARTLLSEMQRLRNWDEHSVYLIDAVETVYDRNGWDSEPDLFSLELFREVQSIPPWQSLQRFNTVTDMISDRYLLDDGQLNTLRQAMIRESVRMFTKHSERILQYAGEAIRTRAASEPFTPEQVARWTELAEPVFNDAKSNMLRMAEELAVDLSPEQRQLLKEDISAAENRLSHFDSLMGDWKAGAWRPEDWGMENDPIQLMGTPRPEAAPEMTEEEALAAMHGESDTPEDQTALPRRPGPDGGPVAEPAEIPPPPGQPAPANVKDDYLARYVQAFIRKYKLNSEQQQKAWLIYNDARDRTDLFTKGYADKRDRLNQRKTEGTAAMIDKRIADIGAEHYHNMQRLFEQMKRRLLRLPTRNQRRDADPAEIKIDVPKPK